MGGRMVIKVFDEDTVIDEVVGSIVINAKNFIGQERCNFENDGVFIPQLNNETDTPDGLTEE